MGITITQQEARYMMLETTSDSTQNYQLHFASKTRFENESKIFCFPKLLRISETKSLDLILRKLW